MSIICQPRIKDKTLICSANAAQLYEQVYHYSRKQIHILNAKSCPQLAKTLHSDPDNLPDTIRIFAAGPKWVQMVDLLGSAYVEFPIKNIKMVRIGDANFKSTHAVNNEMGMHVYTAGSSYLRIEHGPCGWSFNNLRKGRKLLQDNAKLRKENAALAARVSALEAVLAERVSALEALLARVSAL